MACYDPVMQRRDQELVEASSRMKEKGVFKLTLTRFVPAGAGIVDVKR